MKNAQQCLSIIILILKYMFFQIGQPFRRYHSYTEPYNLEQDIKFLLGEAKQPSLNGNAIDYHEKRNPREQNLEENSSEKVEEKFKEEFTFNES
jgi:hypothetical protein